MNISNLDILKNSRLAMGLALFIIAISSGQLIAKEANRTVMVWATQGDLAPGQLISQSDIKAVSVLLPQSAKNYLSAEAEIIGFTQKFHNENKVIINELGYSSRSSHKANMVPVEALGSLIVRFNGIEFEIGTGFVESERCYIWMNKSEFLGKLVKFKYQNFGKYEKPRCPVYLGVRDKKDL